MSEPAAEYDPLHRRHWGWKVFQLAVWAAFFVANIELEWGLSGIAVGVMGGMIAWYSTGIINGLYLLFLRARRKPIPPEYQRSEGQLDAWAREVGLKDKPGRVWTLKRVRPPQEPPSP